MEVYGSPPPLPTCLHRGYFAAFVLFLFQGGVLAVFVIVVVCFVLFLFVSVSFFCFFLSCLFV